MKFDWIYDGHIERNCKVYHVWITQYDGQDIFQITHEPHPSTHLDFVKPTGTGFYTSREAVYYKNGFIWNLSYPPSGFKIDKYGMLFDPIYGTYYHNTPDEWMEINIWEQNKALTSNPI